MEAEISRLLHQSHGASCSPPTAAKVINPGEMTADEMRRALSQEHAPGAQVNNVRSQTSSSGGTKQVDMNRLRTLCMQHGVPDADRALAWKLFLLGGGSGGGSDGGASVDALCAGPTSWGGFPVVDHSSTCSSEVVSEIRMDVELLSSTVAAARSRSKQAEEKGGSGSSDAADVGLVTEEQEEICRMIVYLCEKTGIKYSSALCGVLAPIVLMYPAADIAGSDDHEVNRTEKAAENAAAPAEAENDSQAAGQHNGGGGGKKNKRKKNKGKGKKAQTADVDGGEEEEAPPVGHGEEAGDTNPDDDNSGGQSNKPAKLTPANIDLATPDSPSVSAQIESPVSPSRRWTPLLRVLPNEVFPVLYKLLEKYLPDVEVSSTYSETAEELFRLLLQYHDPKLSMHFDHTRCSISRVVLPWLGDMVVSHMKEAAAALHVWDVLFATNDASFLVFVLLAVLNNRREIFLDCDSREDMLAVATSAELDIDNLPDAVEITRTAYLYAKNTPASTRILLCQLLGAGKNKAPPLEKSPEELLEQVRGYVVLPIENIELMNAFRLQSPGKPRPKHLNFIVLDCRAEKSFNACHLPTAVHVNTDFDLSTLDAVVERFREAQGSHFCILGTGRHFVDEDNLLKLTALKLLQKDFPHVGIAVGGFQACIPDIKADAVENVRGAASTGQPPGPEKRPFSTQPTVGSRSRGRTSDVTDKASALFHQVQTDIKDLHLAARKDQVVDSMKTGFRGFMSSLRATKMFAGSQQQTGSLPSEGGSSTRHVDPAGGAGAPSQGGMDGREEVGATSSVVSFFKRRAGGSPPRPEVQAAHGHHPSDSDEDDDFGLISSTDQVKQQQQAAAVPSHSPRAVVDSRGREVENYADDDGWGDDNKEGRNNTSDLFDSPQVATVVNQARKEQEQQRQRPPAPKSRPGNSPASKPVDATAPPAAAATAPSAKVTATFEDDDDDLFSLDFANLKTPPKVGEATTGATPSSGAKATVAVDDDFDDIFD